MKYLRYIIIFLILSTTFSCQESENQSITCDKTVIIDNNLYKNGPDGYFFFNDVYIEDDCLIIEFSASGCSGESWELALFDAGVVKESYPVQRDIRMSLKNNEDCLAIFTRTVSFNLIPLRNDDPRIYLNLKDWDELLEYRY